eukprot:Lithocolla_globosa_v1_NODE_9638_length_685_cov_2.474603.p2 type:complete len:110 gc:universal NODE_9638_length_685_cov_2.474603:258-587(+)
MHFVATSITLSWYSSGVKAYFVSLARLTTMSQGPSAKAFSGVLARLACLQSTLAKMAFCSSVIMIDWGICLSTTLILSVFPSFNNCSTKFRPMKPKPPKIRTEGIFFPL